jgi:UDP-N-acetylmuramoyl-tripeptide--D-alanyl-D-alanine ligase
MFGLYNASNMLAAYTIGKHFDVSSDSMVNILAAFIPGANRSERISYKGCTVVKDAYNANPSSMELSVKAFSEQYPNGWIVIGDMKELGEITEEAHLHILQLASRMAFDRIYLVGNAFAQAFENSGITDNRIISTDRIESLKAFWNWEECSGKAILLKGSRSMHLEQLLEA